MASLRCPFASCTCAHEGCVAGWIDSTDRLGRERTIACADCRPEVAAQLRGAWGTRAHAVAGLRRLARPSRLPDARPAETAAAQGVADGEPVTMSLW